ncbi:MAG: uncharacterized protein QOF98_1030 [Streptomyces sp.]|nr:uncharacterized protein [Streptomyces sp.]
MTAGQPPGAATVPALYDGHVVHIRRHPLRRVFRHRICLWLVDLDELPAPPWWLPPFVRFRARDHFGAPDRPIRQNLDTWLCSQGVDDLGGGRVLMLASPRVLGHVFNPLTVYWCHRADGRLACVVAEVHNTYGERHGYLLRTGPDGRAVVGKDFYVSPFLAMSGSYHMRLPAPDERLALTVSLVDGGRVLFSAALTGRRTPAAPWNVLRLALAHPLPQHRISAAIRLHGMALWLRGLPVAPRPPHDPRKVRPCPRH